MLLPWCWGCPQACLLHHSATQRSETHTEHPLNWSKVLPTTKHFIFFLFFPVGLISIVYWKRHIFTIASSGVGPTWLPLKTQLLTFFHLFATRCIFIYLWLPIVLFCARTLAVLNFCKCCAKSMECTSLIVKTCINYPQAIISMNWTEFTVLYRYHEDKYAVVEKELITSHLLSAFSEILPKKKKEEKKDLFFHSSNSTWRFTHSCVKLCLQNYFPQ